MRARVSISTGKRLKALENRKTVNKPYALFPEIMGVEEWEALAAPMQYKLMIDTQIGIDSAKL